MTNRHPLLANEPIIFPSRHRFVFDPGVPNKQLWAIGMIVVQWTMTEWWVDVQARALIEGDQALLAEYEKKRNFQQRLASWQTQVELRMTDPVRAQVLALIARIKVLSPQRDEVIYRLWGGGMESASPSAAGLETAEAGLMPSPGEPIPGKGPRLPFTWRLTFQRLRQMATEMAHLNRDLMMLLALREPSQPFASR